MTKLRLLSALALGGSALGAAVACAAFDDAIVREGEGGTADAEAGQPPGDGMSCSSIRLPEPPAATPDDGAINFFVVLRQMAFMADGGAPAQFSFDLDETCSCPERESCTPLDAGTGPRCDFEGGVDNAGGTLVSQGSILGYKLSNFEVMVKEGIERGDNGIVVGVEGYNGKDDDPRVNVSLYRSVGPRDDAGVKKTPAFTPDERWTRLRPDVEEEATRPKSQSAYVKSGVLVAILRTSYLPFRDSYIELQEGRIVARIEKVADGQYALRAGRIVGRWTTKNVFQNLLRVVPPENGGKRLCENPSMIAAFETFGAKNVVCNAADISSSKELDKTTSACDALSVGAGFEAVPTTAGETVDPATGDVCAGVEIKDCTR